MDQNSSGEWIRFGAAKAPNARKAGTFQQAVHERVLERRLVVLEAPQQLAPDRRRQITKLAGGAVSVGQSQLHCLTRFVQSASGLTGSLERLARGIWPFRVLEMLAPAEDVIHQRGVFEYLAISG